MSRIDLTVGKDKECVAGFDPDLETFFFQSGKEDARGAPVHWIGYEPRAVLSLGGLEKGIRAAANQPGFTLPAPARKQLLHEASRHFDQLYKAGALSREENKAIQVELNQAALTL